MINLPTKINNRDDLDCRLGIKSSLSDIASVVALSYACLLYTSDAADE